MPDSRYWARLAARRALAVGSWGSGSVALRHALRRGPRVRALTYHRFGELPDDPFCVSSREFEEQMAWLSGQGLAVTLDEVCEFVAGRRELPDGAVLVTIDDGYESTYTHALPILREHGVPAVAYVTAGAIEGDAREDDPPEPYMSWDQVGRLAEGGIAVGSHAYRHRSLGRLTEADARDEAFRSRESLERHVDGDVLSFAYPFGTRVDFDATTRRVLDEAGYRTAFTSQHGSFARGHDPIELPRVKIVGGEPLWMFQRACDGTMDAWRAVDFALFPLQWERR